MRGERRAPRVQAPPGRGHRHRAHGAVRPWLAARPAPRRPNAATRRWLGRDARGPAWARAANSLAAPLASRLPPALQARLASLQRPGLPLLSPQPPVASLPASLVDAGPLYAGIGVARIGDVRKAAELVAELLA